MAQKLTIDHMVTIGVYGYTAETFFAALQSAGVELLVDIRWRRGVRGSTYAYANSRRLQKRLAELAIGYLYRRDLAPTPAIINRQEASDAAAKVARRKRTQLSREFIEMYGAEILPAFDAASLLNDFPVSTKIVALLCVEQWPAACHRSLVADRLEKIWKVPVVHLTP